MNKIDEKIISSEKRAVRKVTQSVAGEKVVNKNGEMGAIITVSTNLDIAVEYD